MTTKMKNKAHRYNINKPSPRHRHKYTKYKICLSITMVTCIKQHLSNIWSSTMKKWSNTGWVDKKRSLQKKTKRLIFMLVPLTGQQKLRQNSQRNRRISKI